MEFRHNLVWHTLINANYSALRFSASTLLLITRQGGNKVYNSPLPNFRMDHDTPCTKDLECVIYQEHFCKM